VAQYSGNRVAQIVEIRQLYERDLNLTSIRSIAEAPSIEDLAKRVSDLGIDLYKVTAENQSTANKASLSSTPTSLNRFGFLPEAPAILKDQYSDIKNSEVFGLTVSRFDKCCDLERPAILLFSGAEPYTLIHEAVHAVLDRQMNESLGSQVMEVQADYKRLEKKFNFYSFKVLDSTDLLEKRHWREDLVSLITEYTDASLVMFKYSMGEEIIAEHASTLLLKDANSPWATPEQLLEAKQYATYQLSRISVRLGNISYLRSLLVDGTYTSNSAFDITPQERTDSLAKLKESEDKIRQALPKLEVYSTLVKQL
jgi:hypothetical protein